MAQVVKEKTFFRVALCQWYGLAKARELDIARPRRPNKPSWLLELTHNGQRIVTHKNVVASDLRMNDAFRCLCALVVLHGLQDPTVPWLHAFFNTRNAKEAAPRGPRKTSYDLMAELLHMNRLAMDVTSSDLRNYI